ncbi:response regulator [bacterium]|nr:response regulator [bacterium]
MKILLVDKNRHVGSLIKRELDKDHHEVILAENAKNLMLILNTSKQFDLLIIDPDLPDMESGELFKSISQQIHGIPVIFHDYYGDFSQECGSLNVLAYVEKKGNSIDNIRSTIQQAHQSPEFHSHGFDKNQNQ